MVTEAFSSYHITHIFKSLHWLPVEARVNFKILLITYKILNGQSSAYLEPLIKDYHLSRALRSSSRSQLCTPAIKSKMEDARFPAQHLSYGTVSQNISKIQRVLLRSKRNLKHFYSRNIAMIFTLNIFVKYFKVYNMYNMTHRLEIFCFVFVLFLIHVKCSEDGNVLNKNT